jgi:uncharacterized membrane protein YphA (DoxX/SURF4 family)
MRVALGTVFLAQGLAKLLSVGTGDPILATVLYPWLGGGLGLILLIALGLVEAAAGAALVTGAFTRIAAAVLVLTLLPMAWTLLLDQTVLSTWSETPAAALALQHQIILLAGLVCMILTGPGALSIDGHRARSAEAAALGRARLRSGS